MIYTKVEGEKQLAEEMIKMAEMLGKDIDKIVPIAAYVAARSGRKLCDPREKLREVHRRGGPPRKKEISEKTDTSRTSTHWVKFYRQGGKKPFFVPINPNPHSVNFAKPDPEKHGQERFEAWDAARKRKAKVSTPSVYKYQRTRTSTVVNKRGNIMAYDTPKEILSMRTIGRRGLAGEAWSWIANTTRGGQRVSLKRKDLGIKATKKNSPQIEKHARKYTRVLRRKSRNANTMILENNLTYIQKAYGNITNAIVADAAESLEGEAKRRIIARQKALERQAKLKGAA